MSSEDMDRMIGKFMDDALPEIVAILKPGGEGMSMGEKIIHLCQASFLVGLVAGTELHKRVEG